MNSTPLTRGRPERVREISCPTIEIDIALEKTTPSSGEQMEIRAVWLRM